MRDARGAWSDGVLSRGQVHGVNPWGSARPVPCLGGAKQLGPGDDLLRADAGDDDHREPAVVELLVLHRQHLGLILGKLHSELVLARQ